MTAFPEHVFTAGGYTVRKQLVQEEPKDGNLEILQAEQPECLQIGTNVLRKSG